ncbi:CocE/NonD family hydrolase [Salinisphaera sp. T5B8]|uniref:alpha/beta hydrolase n=1 Tax=Salinisphaera sp. T5B8 TaxID=1304154 RepID=UPI00333FADE5
MGIGRVCIRSAAVLITVAGLSACGDDGSVDVGGSSPSLGGGGDTPPVSANLYCDEDAPAQAADSRDAITQSTAIDGTTIDVAMTLYTPALEAGECAPLIVQSHGFGGSRITDLDDVPDDANASELATREAWKAGYFVVSFDQRGFGETGGSVKVENPDFEGRDTRAVIDYAVAELGGHLAYRRGDPVIGALGLSYGGGFQLVASGIDPRIDAIVPAATWYDLTYSLAPNDTPKTVWLDLLVLLGVTGAEGALDPFLYEGFLQAQFGSISDDILDEVRGNGLNAFCDGLRPSEGVPRVDAFIVQGVNDTLFNMNEAVRNAQCLRAAGNDVRLLVQRTGHILPLFQAVQGAFGFDLDPRVVCGNATYDTSERMLSFLDEKLRGVPARPAIDANCFVQDDTHGIVTDDIPIGGARYSIPATTLTTGPVVETVVNVLQGLQVNGSPLLPTIAESLGMTVANLFDTLEALLTNPAEIDSVLTDEVLQLLPPELLNELTAPSRELFLFTADQPMTLAGIPMADLQLDSTADDAIVFVGLGVKRRGETRIDLINTQVAPLRGHSDGNYAQPLVGVSTHLQAGDEVYLMAYGFHNQYYLSFNRLPRVVTLSGAVDLPLLPDDPRP